MLTDALQQEPPKDGKTSLEIALVGVLKDIRQIILSGRVLLAQHAHHEGLPEEIWFERRDQTKASVWVQVEDQGGDARPVSRAQTLDERLEGLHGLHPGPQGHRGECVPGLGLETRHLAGIESALEVTPERHLVIDQAVEQRGCTFCRVDPLHHGQGRCVEGEDLAKGVVAQIRQRVGRADIAGAREGVHRVGEEVASRVERHQLRLLQSDLDVLEQAREAGVGVLERAPPVARVS